VGKFKSIKGILKHRKYVEPDRTNNKLNRENGSSFTCVVKDPGLLSSSPCISNIGFLILLADMKGFITHRVPSSFYANI
jgi:hypothetical protein